MGLPRSLVTEVRRMDEGQLRQLLILARGLLLTSEHPVIEIRDLPGMPTVRYRQRAVTCGKDACGSCPHGPYWYAHWTEDGRRRSRYIGAELPAEVRRKLDQLDLERDRQGDGTDGDADHSGHDIAVAASAGAQNSSGPRRPLRLVTD